jgi:hypothetical protein
MVLCVAAAFLLRHVAEIAAAASPCYISKPFINEKKNSQFFIKKVLGNQKQLPALFVSMSLLIGCFVVQSSQVRRLYILFFALSLSSF